MHLWEKIDHYQTDKQISLPLNFQYRTGENAEFLNTKYSTTVGLTSEFPEQEQGFILILCGLFYQWGQRPECWL